jgi:Tol biopolymer transport system component
VNKRSDIWAFGCVLFEMLTGRRAFDAPGMSDTLAAVLRSEPEWTSLGPQVPETIRTLLTRCLEKDHTRRLRDIGDARLELDAPERSPVPHPTPSGQTADRPGGGRTARLARMARVLSASLVGLGLIAVASVLFVRFQAPVPMVELARFQIGLPAGSLAFTLSPDGRTLAFIAPSPNRRTRSLWIRPMDSLEPRVLPGTEDALTPPFWSPDSRFIAFQAGGTLKKVAVTGGLPQTICDAPVVIGGAWNQDGVILFGNGAIMRVSAEGGVATPVTLASQGGAFHSFPSFLPDARHFVYLRYAGPTPQASGIYLGSLDTIPEQQSAQRLLDTPLMPTYAPSLDSGAGHLLFMRESTLLAQPFDVRRLALAGGAVPVAERVGSFRLSAYFSTSATGVLAYRNAGTILSNLVWYDRAGTLIGPAGEQGAYWDVALSPDGTRVALTLDDERQAAGQGISVLEFARGVTSRVTFDAAPDSTPVWSPDGRRIAFVASRPDGTGVFHKASGSGGKEEVLLPPTSAVKWPNDWSRDGRFLLFSSQEPGTKLDLWVLPLTGDGAPAGPPAPFLQTEFNERQGQFSPDTHWIAYVSDESGKPEVYVQPFPASSGEDSRVRISVDGGSQPRWRRDGNELFYVSLDGTLMAADVSMGPALKAGVPKVLFAPPIQIADEVENSFQWDVAASGDRFLINTASTALEPMTVVLNWTAALRK